MNTGDRYQGTRLVPLCPNCREVNGYHEHEGDIFECIHCDQLFTFNPIGRRLPDDAIESFISEQREQSNPLQNASPHQFNAAEEFLAGLEVAGASELSPCPHCESPDGHCPHHRGEAWRQMGPEQVWFSIGGARISLGSIEAALMLSGRTVTRLEDAAPPSSEGTAP